MNAHKIIGRITGKIINCPHCYGDGLDEKMRTCKRCDGAGTILLE